MSFRGVFIAHSVNGFRDPVLYIVIVGATMWRWTFYVLFGVIEIVLSVLVFWCALRWPRRSVPGEST
jgi:H+/Cl- antiporter ClcA